MALEDSSALQRGLEKVKLAKGELLLKSPMNTHRDDHVHEARDERLKHEAEGENSKGLEAYKCNQFDTARKSFECAWQMWPKDVKFLTNIGGKCSSVTVSLENY